MFEQTGAYALTHLTIMYGLKVKCPVARCLRALGGDTLNPNLSNNSSTCAVKQEELHSGPWRI